MYLDLGPDLREVGIALGGGAGGPEPGNKNKMQCQNIFHPNSL